MRIKLQIKALLKVFLTVVFLASTSQSAFALNFGQIQIKSHLGEPLQINIPLKDLDKSITINDLSAKLSDVYLYNKNGIFLTPDQLDYQFRIVKRRGVYSVRITSKKPINDSALDFMVAVNEKGMIYNHQFEGTLKQKPAVKLAKEKASQGSTSAINANSQETQPAESGNWLRYLIVSLLLIFAVIWLIVRRKYKKSLSEKSNRQVSYTVNNRNKSLNKSKKVGPKEEKKVAEKKPSIALDANNPDYLDAHKKNQQMLVNLDLAQVYIESNTNIDKAKELLNDVAKQGTDQQKQIASKLLKHID